jgi:hypothetical protein
MNNHNDKNSIFFPLLVSFFGLGERKIPDKHNIKSIMPKRLVLRYGEGAL